MGHRELFALGGFQIVSGVGVQSSKNLSLKIKDFVHHLGYDGLGLRGTQSAVHKILLHIHYN